MAGRLFFEIIKLLGFWFVSYQLQIINNKMDTIIKVSIFNCIFSEVIFPYELSSLMSL